MRSALDTEGTAQGKVAADAICEIDPDPTRLFRFPELLTLGEVTEPETMDGPEALRYQQWRRTFIWSLRETLLEATGGRRLINISGVGYRLGAPPETVEIEDAKFYSAVVNQGRKAERRIALVDTKHLDPVQQQLRENTLVRIGRHRALLENEAYEQDRRNAFRKSVDLETDPET